MAPRQLTSAPEPTPHLAEPTPSMRAQYIAVKLRGALQVLLVLDIILYVFGSLVSLGDTSAVDLLLVFVGWYAADILRARTLHIYAQLSILSAVVDTLVLIIRVGFLLAAKAGVVAAVLLCFWLVETWAKIRSIQYARTLRDHLYAVPGQSVEITV